MDLKIVCIVSYGFGVNKFISSIKIRCLALVQKKFSFTTNIKGWTIIIQGETNKKLCE